MKGQMDVEGIIGAIISIFLLIIFVSALLPALSSIGNQGDKDRAIQALRDENSVKDNKIASLESVLSSLNSTLSDKDSKISDLSVLLLDKDKQITNLTNELETYRERQYVNQVNNYFYNISNNLETIENRFFPIEISVSILSASLLFFIVKEFNVVASIRNRFVKRKSNNADNTNQKGN